MDAAERAELEVLRRRAYGVDSDIHDDPAALAGLNELEELARPAAAPAPAPDPLEHATPMPTAAVDAITEAGPPDPVERPRARVSRSALVTSAAVVLAVVVGAVLLRPTVSEPSGTEPTEPAATAPARELDSTWVYAGDPDAQRLMTISLDSSYTNYVDWPTDRPIPEFPSTNPLRWATPIGRYYGWSLWVAGGGDFPATEHCILIERGSVVRARCLDGRRQDAGGLRVSIGPSDIGPGELPSELASDQRIRFWWLRDGNVDVVLGRFDPD
jgi:hypothetical protein